MRLLHPARVRRTAELAQLDPTTDWQEIYRRLTLWELPSEARLGFQLAFYRPFAVPRMAAVLQRTGHFKRNTTRRAYDTGIVIHEIIWGGVDSERGAGMVRLMNALHARPDIYPQDMSYILDALIVVPTRLMDRLGWRPTTSAEREATFRFYQALGDRMRIVDLPNSYADAVARFDQYEATELGPSPAGLELTEAVLRTLRSRLPRPIRPIAPQVTSALIGDARVSRALGLQPAGRIADRVLAAGSALRRAVERVTSPPAEPSFRPGRPAGTVYPHGYELDQIGPQ